MDSHGALIMLDGTVDVTVPPLLVLSMAATSVQEDNFALMLATGKWMPFLAVADAVDLVMMGPGTIGSDTEPGGLNATC
jgi:hypothetical protein